MERELTIMAVHAHPDDEVISTGGVLARYAEEGIRTVLVTCTNGEQGDGPGGVKPGEPGHDNAAVAEVRLGELRESVGHLGITDLELLGYHDSGMDGWAGNDDPIAFCNIPFEQATERLAELIRKYRPQVVVTYDENGGYGHPDHIQAHRIAVAATEATGIPDKLYFSAMSREGAKSMFDEMRATGLEMPDFEIPDDFGTPDEQITATVDVAKYAERKTDALRSHQSQSDGTFFLNMPAEIRALMFSTEGFIRQFSKVDAPEREDDLFAGLRGTDR